MRRLASLTAALALVLATAAHAAKWDQGDLIGPWDGDVEGMLKATGMLQQMPPNFDASAMLAQFSMTLTFHEKGTVTMVNKTMEGEETETYPFEVVDSEENTLHLKSTDEEGEEFSAFVTFHDQDTIEVLLIDTPPMTFTRAKAKSKKAVATE